MNMVTYYNTKDMVGFGNYLLSQDRQKSVEARLRVQALIEIGLTDGVMSNYTVENQIKYDKFHIDRGISHESQIPIAVESHVDEFTKKHSTDLNMIGVSGADVSNWKEIIASKKQQE